jgi:predicted nucleic acid-binding protein
VSNTTPLFTLAEVGLLDLLASLYGEIWIPDIVEAEYEAGRSRFPTRAGLDRLPWLSIHRVPVDPAVVCAPDVGEAETIALAQSCHARVVLLDERRGRRGAGRLGPRVAGTIAVLVAAKEEGRLLAVRPILDQVIAQGRWIGPEVRREILRLAGEDLP